MDRPRPASVEIDGDRLRKLRKLRGKSVSQLAADSEISVQYLSFIERGQRRPMPDVFARICDALDIQGDAQRSELILDGDRSVA